VTFGSLVRSQAGGYHVAAVGAVSAARKSEDQVTDVILARRFASARVTAETHPFTRFHRQSSLDAVDQQHGAPNSFSWPSGRASSPQWTASPT
jgi:hypothetical protein